jgi:hypothetical protein
MAHNNDTPSNGLMMRTNTAQERMPPNSKGRKFFQQMQPTFAVDVPRTTTRLQFLDENDPAKDTVIRKKAREWVNMNRKMKKQHRGKQRLFEEKETTEELGMVQDCTNQLQRRSSSDELSLGSPTTTVGSQQFDPFHILPDIGRDYKSIIDFCEFTRSSL